MKKLFKSAFKSIFNFKIGLVLLSTIVFLTAGTFTLFNSASNAFKQSFNSVTQEGALHDFTVKELYSIEGKPNLEAKREKREIVKRFNKGNKTVEFKAGKPKTISMNENGIDYLIVPVWELKGAILVEEKPLFGNWKKGNLGSFRIKFDDLKMVDTNNDGVADTLTKKTTGDLKSDWFYYDWGIWKYLYGIDDNDWTESKVNTTRNLPLRSNYSITPAKKYRAKITDMNRFYQELFNYMKRYKLLEAYDKTQISVESVSPTITYSYMDILNPANKSKFEAFLRSNLSDYPLKIDTALLKDSSGKDLPNTELAKVPKISEQLNKIRDSLKTLANENKSQKFVDEVNSIYGSSGSKGHLLDFNKINTIEVNSATGARKIVSVDKNRKVDKLVKFKGYDMPETITLGNKNYNAPMSQNDLYSLMKSFNNIRTEDDEKIPNLGDKDLLLTYKGYKLSANWNNEVNLVIKKNKIPASNSILDPTSLMAHVSPTFAEKNNLSYVNPNKIIDLYYKAIKDHNENAIGWFNQEIIKKYSSSLVWIDQTPYVAIGSAITPDFAYPIVGPDKPMPNPNEEAILFTNENGFKRIEDAWRGSPRENYIGYKFTGEAKGKESQIKTELEVIANKNMSWGNNVEHIVSDKFDTSETVILAPNRIAFLNTLQSSILTLSVILTTALAIFAVVVVALVIKKHINSHKKHYAILMANGYSKTQVSLSSTVIAFLAIIIPSALGYIFGHFMQYILIGQFSSVWTLPIIGHTFNWWALLSMVVFPFMAGALMTFGIAMWEMKGTIPQILAGSSSKISGILSSKILGPLKYVGIKTKSAMSLFITNISKMVLIFISSAMAIVTISVAISTIDKFDNARNASIAATSYSYDVKFSAPTEEGGVIKSTHLYNLGLSDQQKNQGMTINDVDGKTILQNRTSPTVNIDTFMTPVKEDAQFQNDPKYLKHLIQTKTLLNIFAGGFGIGANPWDIAKKLMPENQLNIANKKDNDFIKFASSLPVNSKYKFGGSEEILNADGTINPDKVKKGFIFDGINDKLKEFFWNGFKAAYQEYKDTGSLEHMPYFITYDSVILGDNDETYTNVSGYTNKSNFKNSSSKHDFDIKGIKDNSKYINLSKDAWNALKNNPSQKVNGTLEIPVVVNKYFQSYYNINKGDIIDYSVTSASDRFKNGPTGLVEKNIKLKIVEFQDSYNDQMVYTLQEYAREAMNWQKTDPMFNGVFTSETNPVVFNSIALYSFSGLYPAADTIPSDQSTEIYKNFNNEIKNNPPHPAIKNMDDYIATYSKNPYVTFSNVNWSGAEQFRFQTTSDLSQVLILFIESVTIFLSVLFIIIIAIMMIEDNKKFIATLKVMGYRSREITRIFFGSFVPSFIIAIFMAGPIAFGMAELMRFAIMSFGSILIPISLTWWTILLAFVITLGGAMITYLASSRGLKNTKMLQAFAQ